MELNFGALVVPVVAQFDVFKTSTHSVKTTSVAKSSVVQRFAKASFSDFGGQSNPLQQGIYTVRNSFEPFLFRG
jgi:hypothetical protein